MSWERSQDKFPQKHAGEVAKRDSLGTGEKGQTLGTNKQI